jgi:hypothetical protein
MRRVMRRAAAATAVAAVGCTAPIEAPPGVECGEGTVLVEDRCVAADASIGDVTGDDARGGEETNHGATDSGLDRDGPSDSSPADSSLVDSAPETSDDSRSDMGVDVVVAGDGDGDTAIGADTFDAIGGDPCPVPPPDVDCSAYCGGPTTLCTRRYTCDPTMSYPPVLINSYSQLPFTIRMPDHPGIDLNCQPRCGPDNTVWGFAVRFEMPYFKYDGIKIKVGPGWKVYGFDPYHPFCSFAPSNVGQQCWFVDTAKLSLFIGTTDPAAVSRNVTIEYVPSGGLRCP